MAELAENKPSKARPAFGLFLVLLGALFAFWAIRDGVRHDYFGLFAQLGMALFLWIKGGVDLRDLVLARRSRGSP